MKTTRKVKYQIFRKLVSNLRVVRFLQYYKHSKSELRNDQDVLTWLQMSAGTKSLTYMT